MNEPSWLAQITSYVTNNFLNVTRFADWNSPSKTGVLTLLICVLAYFLWLIALDIKNTWGRGGLIILSTIAWENAATIALVAAKVWGPF